MDSIRLSSALLNERSITPTHWVKPGKLEKSHAVLATGLDGLPHAYSDKTLTGQPENIASQIDSTIRHHDRWGPPPPGRDHPRRSTGPDSTNRWRPVSMAAGSRS